MVIHVHHISSVILILITLNSILSFVPYYYLLIGNYLFIIKIRLLKDKNNDYNNGFT